MKAYKKSAHDALMRYMENDLKEIQKLNAPKRKNERPEKEVEKACLKWMREKQWEVQIIESKGTWSPAAGRWLPNRSVKTGNADCQGVMPNGVTVAVEFKAPGKLGDFWRMSHKGRKGNEAQQEFIIKRIRMHAFAVVVDSVERLEHLYNRWRDLRLISNCHAQTFLMDNLPTVPKRYEKRQQR